MTGVNSDTEASTPIKPMITNKYKLTTEGDLPTKKNKSISIYDNLFVKKKMIVRKILDFNDFYN